MIAAALAAAAAQALPAKLTGDIFVYAAGSLRAALSDVADAYTAAHPGVRIRCIHGASGLLKERVLAGEKADVYASANIENHRSL